MGRQDDELKDDEEDAQWYQRRRFQSVKSSPKLRYYGWSVFVIIVGIGLIAYSNRSANNNAGPMEYARQKALAQSLELNALSDKDIQLVRQDHQIVECLFHLARNDSDSRLRQGAILVLYRADRIPDATWLSECSANEQDSAVMDTITSVIARVEEDKSRESR